MYRLVKSMFHCFFVHHAYLIVQLEERVSKSSSNKTDNFVCCRTLSKSTNKKLQFML